jgi:hypothetical protein
MLSHPISLCHLVAHSPSFRIFRTAMSILLIVNGHRWDCYVGDTLTVLAPFANHALTTMMMQMNCEVCDDITEAKVTEIDSIALWLCAKWPRLVHIKCGECSEIATPL